MRLRTIVTVTVPLFIHWSLWSWKKKSPSCSGWKLYIFVVCCAPPHCSGKHDQAVLYLRIYFRMLICFSVLFLLLCHLPVEWMSKNNNSATSTLWWLLELQLEPNRALPPCYAQVFLWKVLKELWVDHEVFTPKNIALTFAKVSRTPCKLVCKKSTLIPSRNFLEILEPGSERFKSCCHKQPAQQKPQITSPTSHSCKCSILA